MMERMQQMMSGMMNPEDMPGMMQTMMDCISEESPWKTVLSSSRI